MSIAPESSKAVFEKTERALRKLCDEQPAETVHNFRTTSLRLQTLLEQLVPQRDRNQKKLLKMLKRIRRRAGRVRDLDVQLAALRSLKVPQEPRRKTQLMHALIELRAKHEKKLRKSLDKKTISEIRMRLKRGSKEVKPESCLDPLTIGRAMLGKVKRPVGPVTEEVLHQYRGVVKRARYAAEFAPKSATSAQFITGIKRLQDAVGNWHDWLILTQTAAERLREVDESSLLAALHHLTGSKFRQAIAAFSISPQIVSPPIQSPQDSIPISSDGARKPSLKKPTPAEQGESAA
jgi:CHAD domain-containing protein